MGELHTEGVGEKPWVGLHESEDANVFGDLVS